MRVAWVCLVIVSVGILGFGVITVLPSVAGGNLLIVANGLASIGRCVSRARARKEILRPLHHERAAPALRCGPERRRVILRFWEMIIRGAGQGR